MRDLIQMIQLLGPEDKNDLLVLLALASFAEDDGMLRGLSESTLAKLARMPEVTFRRHLRRLTADGWVFLFGRGRDEVSQYLLNLRKVATVALIAGVHETATVWAEQQLGIVPFPQRTEAREAMRR